MKRSFENTADGLWLAKDGARIVKVSPRGAVTLYAVTLPGTSRPTWHDTLAEAKRYGEEH